MQNEPISITWKKKDADKGYAVGSLQVLQGHVPVIIEGYRLAPLDVIMLPEMTIPLNDYFLQKLFHKPEAFSGLAEAEPKNNEMLFSGNNYLQFSPVNEYNSNHTSRISRDAVKVASVIDSISFIHKDDAKEILSYLQDDSVKTAYEKNGNLDVLEKIAKKAKDNTKTAQLENYLRNLEIDRQLVYSDQFGNKMVKQANSRINKT